MKAQGIDPDFDGPVFFWPDDPKPETKPSLEQFLLMASEAPSQPS
jgi:hypothetical protein